VLADDHAALRRSLRRVLDSADGVEVVAEAVDLPTAVRDVRSLRPHVLVIDLRLPNGSSIERIRQLRDQVPETEVVVLTMDESPLFAQQALDAGAVAFVLKDRANAELLTAIRRATNGEEYVSPQVAPGLEALRRAVDRDGLSPRETELLRLIALGHTSAEIAAKLHVSRRTVETHRARVYDKLGLKSRAELVQFALRRGMFRA
jgi:DNA-binding NarL/FixJ family response regulator